MNASKIKSNLRDYYNQEATLRNQSKKQDWKKEERRNFHSMATSENKKHLLELGAGAGYDSLYFMQQGFDVQAVDISSEMVKLCKEKGINAHELDFYNLSILNQKFDCIWSMNSLLHVPKADFKMVLRNIASVLKQNGLFYMGVYGGEDAESDWVNDVSDTPRFFSYYTEANLKDALQEFFKIVSFTQYDVGRVTDFQSVIMRKVKEVKND